MRFSNVSKWAIALTCAWGLAGCHHYRSAPTLPTDDPDYKPGGISRDGLADDPPIKQVLLPGDTVTVRTVSTESFEYAGLVVDAEGKIHVPAAGPIHVEGLAPQEAERRVEESLRRFDRFLRASILVSEWGGHTATLVGALTTEGAHPVVPGMRLAELVASAGGPLRTNLETGEPSFIADLDAARLMRDGKALPISLRLALEGDPLHNVFVHPGDLLFVPAGLGARIAVLGMATTGLGGAMVTYRPGLRVTEAIALAQGITIDADDDDVRVVRGPLSDPIVYQWSLEDLVEERAGDIELAPGDVVYVSRHWVAKMGEVIDRISPLLAVVTSSLNTYLLIRTVQNQNDSINRGTVVTTPQGLSRAAARPPMPGMTLRRLD